MVQITRSLQTADCLSQPNHIPNTAHEILTGIEFYILRYSHEPETLNKPNHHTKSL